MFKKYKNKILLKNAECIDIKGLEPYLYEAVNIIVKNTILIFFISIFNIITPETIIN